MAVTSLWPSGRLSRLKLWWKREPESPSQLSSTQRGKIMATSLSIIKITIHCQLIGEASMAPVTEVTITLLPINPGKSNGQSRVVRLASLREPDQETCPVCRQCTAIVTSVAAVLTTTAVARKQSLTLLVHPPKRKRKELFRQVHRANMKLPSARGRKNSIITVCWWSRGIHRCWKRKNRK